MNLFKTTLLMSLLTGLFLVGLAVVEFIYFFPFAAAFSLVAGLGTLMALRSERQLS